MLGGSSTEVTDSDTGELGALLSSPCSSQLPSQQLPSQQFGSSQQATGEQPSSKPSTSKGSSMYVRGRYRKLPALCDNDELAEIAALYDNQQRARFCLHRLRRQYV